MHSIGFFSVFPVGFCRWMSWMPFAAARLRRWALCIKVQSHEKNASLTGLEATIGNPFCPLNRWDSNGEATTTKQGGLHGYQCKPRLLSSSVFTMQWSHTDLLRELLRQHKSRWFDRLPSRGKRSIKPAGPYSQTLKKSSQIVSAGEVDRSSEHPRMDILAPLLPSSFSHLMSLLQLWPLSSTSMWLIIAKIIMARKKNP